MHGGQNDGLVEEYLVQWISVISQHDVVLMISFHEFRLKYACFLFEVDTEMLEAQVHRVGSWQTIISCEVCPSVVEYHSQPLYLLPKLLF